MDIPVAMKDVLLFRHICAYESEIELIDYN